MRIYVCTCAQDGKRRGGLEGTPAITADVFKMEKPLVTCVGKTTVLVQQQRLHGTYRRSGSRERTGEGNRRGEEGGGGHMQQCPSVGHFTCKTKGGLAKKIWEPLP